MPNANYKFFFGSTITPPRSILFIMTEANNNSIYRVNKRKCPLILILAPALLFFFAVIAASADPQL